jgi:hypothetical protein
VFTLSGRNLVKGLTFSDARLHQPDDVDRPTLLLGRMFVRALAGAPRRVDDVVITGNVFDKVYRGVQDGGLPIARLFVTANLFGAYFDAMLLGGNRYNMTDKFLVEDSVIAYNMFEPGSFHEAIASQIGGSRHLDFSNNEADGTATDYLNSPGDPSGWRAAFFWHMNNSNEMMLVSENIATCTGDKGSDGEAIAYDNNANTFGFDRARKVLEASSDSVTVQGPLQSRQNGSDVRLESYYVGHWVQVGQGRGLGQVRKITAYRLDPSGRVTFTIAPAWDVVPAAGESVVSVGREFWQVYTVANRVDHRQPLCKKSNRTRPKGGVIGLWAQTSDSVVEGNRQYDTDGILYMQHYSGVDPQVPDAVSGSFFQSFLEIRDNTIDGKYDWDSDCDSGIQGAEGASATPASPPPTVGYGVNIAHNTVVHADLGGGGAISIFLASTKGPPPHDWVLVDNTLIQHNVIRDIAGPGPRRQCTSAPSSRRIGINLNQAMIWRTVLYANTCTNVAMRFHDAAMHTLRYCPRARAEPDSCECFGSADVQTDPGAGFDQKQN